MGKLEIDYGGAGEDEIIEIINDEDFDADDQELPGTEHLWVERK
jgi:hypothetical protein